ncbi:MAG TPA: CoA transferase [Chloroflexota bacterium]|nr:CoA transferase [Chloroflexota bacterium]
MRPLEGCGLCVLDATQGETGAAAVRILAQLGARVAPCDRSARRRERTTAEGHADLLVIDGTPAGRLDDPAHDSGARTILTLTPMGPAPSSRGGGLCSVAGIRLDAGVPALLTAAHGVAAALAALRLPVDPARARQVEVSALEVIVHCLGDELPRALCPRWTNVGTEDRPARTMIVSCADGFVGIAVPTTDHREYLARFLGVRGPSADLEEATRGWARGQKRREAAAALQLWRIPAVPVLSPQEAAGNSAGNAGPDREARHSGPAQYTPRPKRLKRAIGAEALPRPLADLRVLDLGVIWAGPYAGRLMAALGARVLKIERPDGMGGGGGSCPGAAGDLNAGKASLAVDLRQPAGRAALRSLAAQADVLVENFSPRVMPNFDLPPAALAEINPRLITLSMPAFEPASRWGNYTCLGSLMELAAGLWSLGARGEPRTAPVPYLDYLSGALGACAALAAILARDRTGRGGHLCVPQYDVARELLRDGSPPDQRGDALAMDPRAIAGIAAMASSGFIRIGQDDASGPCHHFKRPPWTISGLPAISEPWELTDGRDPARALLAWGGPSSRGVDALLQEHCVGEPGRSRSAG